MVPVPFAGHLWYDAIWIATYAAWWIFEIVSGRARKSADPKKARDRGSYWFLICDDLDRDGAGVYILFRPAAGVHSRGCARELFFLGIALMWAGIVFRWYCMRVLGRYFTYQVDVHAGQTVIEAGPYRYIRHPSYAGALITVIGLGLTLGNWASLFAVVACVTTGYAYRMRVEEAALVTALGQPYSEYMRRTSRLVPFVL